LGELPPRLRFQGTAGVGRFERRGNDSRTDLAGARRREDRAGVTHTVSVGASSLYKVAALGIAEFKRVLLVVAKLFGCAGKEIGSRRIASHHFGRTFRATNQQPEERTRYARLYATTTGGWGKPRPQPCRCNLGRESPILHGRARK
jgi:hypothetical protein